MDKPGIGSETFELRLDSDWFKKGDAILAYHAKGRILSEPIRKYSWWDKVLIFLWLRRFVSFRVYYTVKFES